MGSERGLYEQVFAIADKRDRRFAHRWVLSQEHVQAFYDLANDERRRQRERLVALADEIPGFNPDPYLGAYEPLPPPDFEGAHQLYGMPVRVADVTEIELERLP
jgi:hypothetical protein